MKHYQADEFLYDDTLPDTKTDAIEKKVSLLYDFCVLTKHKGKPDVREQAVRELLAQYSTEQQMSNVLHPVLVGDSTLNKTLQKGGVM